MKDLLTDHKKRKKKTYDGDHWSVLKDKLRLPSYICFLFFSLIYTSGDGILVLLDQTKEKRKNICRSSMIAHMIDVFLFLSNGQHKDSSFSKENVKKN